MNGSRVGPNVGAVVGSQVGSIRDSSPLSSVARDATSSIYTPANAGQWTTALGVAGITTGNPTSLYLCQEAAGNLADSIGANTLTQLGAGHLYQQAVAGWTRKAVTTVDGTANQRWINSTTSPNPSTSSTLLYAILRLPAAAPAAMRDVMMKANNCDIRFNTTSKLRIQAGAGADLVNASTGTTQPVVLRSNITSGDTTVFTRQERFVGTFVLPTSGNVTAIGGQSTAAGDIGYLYVVEFAGAAAEMQDEDVHAMLTTLGWSLLWSP